MPSLTVAPSTACGFVRTCLLWSFSRGPGICLVGGKAGRSTGNVKLLSCVLVESNPSVSTVHMFCPWVMILRSRPLSTQCSASNNAPILSARRIQLPEASGIVGERRGDLAALASLGTSLASSNLSHLQSIWYPTTRLPVQSFCFMNSPDYTDGDTEPDVPSWDNVHLGTSNGDFARLVPLLDKWA
jgi:hypothetical protein